MNLESKEEVDELYRRWQQAGAKIVAGPEDKPWRLREFRVADLDDNQLRVFLRLFVGTAAGAGVGHTQPRMDRWHLDVHHQWQEVGMISSRSLLKRLSTYILARTAEPDKANFVSVAPSRLLKKSEIL